MWPTHLPPTLAYPEVPAWWVLERNLERFSQRLALRMLDYDTGAELGTLTYEALWEAVRALAAGFRSLGIDRGDRVAFVLPNGPELIIGYYATWFVGATVVPLNPALTEPELAEITHELIFDIVVILKVAARQLFCSTAGIGYP